VAVCRLVDRMAGSDLPGVNLPDCWKLRNEFTVRRWLPHATRYSPYHGTTPSSSWKVPVGTVWRAIAV
jgi:hypothetical protein